MAIMQQPARASRKRAASRRAVKATRPAKPNPFDDIARQVNADQEAKDRAAGRDDLSWKAATSVDQPKAKPTRARATRDGRRPSRQPTARSRPKSAAKPPVITVQRGWSGPVPRGMPELKGATLVTRYELRPDDGTVWSTLSQVLGPDGRPLEDFWRLPLDYRPHPETLGNRRKVVLKDRTRDGLQAWLVKAGLAR
jgi:hypothetical protein